MKFRGRLAASLLVSACLQGSGAAELEVGFAAGDITPPVGMRLCGSFNERLAEGVHDPLQVRAFVFQQGETVCAIAGCDLAMVFPHIGEEVRKRLADPGLEPDSILIHASETHNGPDYYGEFRDVFHKRAIAEQGHDPAEPFDYGEFLISRLASTIREAFEKRKPAELSFAETQCRDIAFNRRFRMKDGSVGWNPGKGNPEIVEPLGPVDERVPLITIQHRDSDDEFPDAVLTGFALHLAILNEPEYAADYPFFLGQRLRAEWGEGTFVHFLQAPCCEVNHIDVSHKRPQKGYDWAKVVGERIADSVLLARPAASPLESPSLRWKARTVPVKLQEFSGEETSAARTLWHDPERGKRPFLEVVRAGKIASIADRHGGGPVDVLLQAIQLDDDTAILGLPGEVSVELGLLLREKSPFPNTIVVQLSNDWFGYLPSQKIFEEGHYEAEVAKIEPGEGERLVEESLQLLKELRDAP